MKITTIKIEKLLDQKEIILYPTLVQINGKNYLIDCGYEETFNEFVFGLTQLGVTIEDLHGLIISHDDIDHLGALHLFKKANPNLIIYCGKYEEPSVSGKIKSERLIQAENSFAAIPAEYKDWAIHFINRLKKIKRVAVDAILKEGDRIEEEMIVIETPGHTKGHISIHLPKEKTVIANDAIVIEEDELNIANPSFTLNMDEALKSVEKIKALHPNKLICYHGGIMDKNVHDKLERLLWKYRNYKQ